MDAELRALGADHMQVSWRQPPSTGITYASSLVVKRTPPPALPPPFAPSTKQGKTRRGKLEQGGAVP